jgi:hypothetical protein
VVIIDDNSTASMVRATGPMDNVTVVASEYHGRGELLPYLYLLQHKWFDAAVILHDSVFIHSRIPFETFRCPVLPLWHHPYDNENVPVIQRLIGALTRNPALFQLCASSGESMPMQQPGAASFNLCFGCQAYIQLSFLQHLQRKYRLSNLIPHVRTRTDRCALERVLGAMFQAESPARNAPSLFGNIRRHPFSFTYSMQDYERDRIHRRRLKQHFVKVWTGR